MVLAMDSFYSPFPLYLPCKYEGGTMKQQRKITAKFAVVFIGQSHPMWWYFATDYVVKSNFIGQIYMDSRR